MKYSVVVFPSSNVQEVANSYRKRYDSAYALIPPFVRLRESFELSEDRLPELIRHLQDVAESTEAFDVTFHRVATFHPTSNVVYLAIQDKTPFEELHGKLSAFPVGTKETYAYVPHLTIGRNLNDDECKDVYGQLSMVKFDLHSSVDHIHLVSEGEDGKWKVHQSFPLKK
jgi:2'-5' RNA ligase